MLSLLKHAYSTRLKHSKMSANNLYGTDTLEVMRNTNTTKREILRNQKELGDGGGDLKSIAYSLVRNTYHT
jgi:hypothetical protein